MSEVFDNDEGSKPPKIIKVLFALSPDFDLLELAGPLEVFTAALHNMKDPSTKAFDCRYVSVDTEPTSVQDIPVKRHWNYGHAEAYINAYDVLIILSPSAEELDAQLASARDFPTANATAPAEEVFNGSAPSEYIDPETKGPREDTPALDKLTQPLGLIKLFAELQKNDPTRERTLIAIGTGSLLLAQLGLFQGLAATTHPDHYTKFEIICQDAARRGDYEQTDVMEERYVVNNARFNVGNDEENNPWILSKRPDGKTKTKARKGSMTYKESSKKEGILKRAGRRIGGLRLITSGGTAAGLDVALYLVAAMVSHESAEEVARLLQYKWEKGVTVDGIDV